MRNYKPWTIPEEKQLQQLLAGLVAEGYRNPIAQAARVLKRSYRSVEYKVRQLGLLRSGDVDRDTRVSLVKTHRREWLCPHCGLNMMVQGDAGWPHGRCVACNETALAFATRQSVRESIAKREHGAERTEKSRLLSSVKKV